jgi:RNA polymerase sigma-70 factor (ECF subfamily)
MHAPAVFRVVSSSAGYADAADLVHDVFVRALERLPSLQAPDRFRPWLLAIARNVAIDALRSRGRVRVTAADEDAQELADARPGPADLSELAELTMLVRGAVAGLSPRDAAAVTMVTQLGYSVAEVAAVFGVSPGAAKVLLHRARRRLRAALALEMLVRRRGDGCSGLAAIDQEDVVGAGRHIRNCPICLALAQQGW